MQFILNSQTADRSQIARALEDYCRENQVPPKVYQAADLALEEHLTNVIKYSFTDEASSEIRIRFGIAAGCLEVEVEDNGQPFNPLNAAEVDTTLALEDKPIGGLGIHLMRKFMDDLHYRREAGRNILAMSKRLDAA